MGKKDTALKQYLSDPEIFADLFNGFLFEGEQVLSKDKITPVDSASSVQVQNKDGKTQLVQKYRDVIRRAALGAHFVVLGIENQMNVHYAMPVRSMLYDALSYTEQVTEVGKRRKAEGRLTGDEYLSGFGQKDKLIPTITIVVYYGETPWDGGTELYDLLDFGESKGKLERYLPNYKMNLLQVNEAEELERYQTGLRELFGILKYRQDGMQLKRHMEANEERYRNLDDATYQTIKCLTNMEDWLLQEEEYQTEGGKWNMMQAFEQLKEQYLRDGMRLGEERGIRLGEERGIRLGEERGIKLGEERGIRLGEERGIKLGEERGIRLGEVKGRKIGEIKGILQTMKEYGSLKENAVEKVVKRYPKDQDLVHRLADEIFAN